VRGRYNGLRVLALWAAQVNNFTGCVRDGQGRRYGSFRV